MSVVSGTGSWIVTFPVRQTATGDINLTGATAAACRFALGSGATDAATETVAAPPFQIDLTPHISGKIIVPGSLCFTWGSHTYVDRSGIIYKDPSHVTGAGVEAGVIDYTTGLVTLNNYDSGSNVIVVKSLLAREGHQFIQAATFRLPGAPIKPQSFEFVGVASDGRQISGGGDFSGVIVGTLVRGVVDYEQGICYLNFGEMVDSIGHEEEPWYRPEDVVGGQIWMPLLAFADQLEYTCTVYSYLPVDKDIIGVNPVRLPPDGRVPVAHAGDYVVVFNSQQSQLPWPLTAGQVLQLPREDITRVEVYDSSEPQALRVPSTKYTWNKDIQRLAMATPLDLAGFTPPLIALHTIEDMRKLQQVQINGHVVFNYGLSHDYPIEGTFISTAIPYGDLAARVTGMFDQKTWGGVWSDYLIGDASGSGFDDLNFPIVTTNGGAITGRWALVIKTISADIASFSIVEERLGIIGTGWTNQDCAPINPAVGKPYWTVPLGGWGLGWPINSVLRFNTIGACPHLWIVRTNMPGEPSVQDDYYTIHFRGNGD